MDPEPAAVTRSSYESLSSTHPSVQNQALEPEQEEPYSLSNPSIAILGLAIAIATVAAPLGAVLNDRPLRGSPMVPAALESDGSKTATPISFPGPGESCRRDSCR